jgi:hypothetical protein
MISPVLVQLHTKMSLKISSVRYTVDTNKIVLIQTGTCYSLLTLLQGQYLKENVHYERLNLYNGEGTVRASPNLNLKLNQHCPDAADYLFSNSFADTIN